MDWLFGAYSAARVTTDAISVGTNDYTHRASEVFKSANPPKVADLNQLIQEYSTAKGTEGTALMGIGNHLFAKKSPAERNNTVILLASLIKNIIDANTYTNIISKLQVVNPAITKDDFFVVLFKLAQLKYSGTWNSDTLYKMVDTLDNTVRLNNVKNKLQDDFFADASHGPDASDGPIFTSFKTAMLQYKKDGRLKTGWFWGGRRTRKGKSRSKGHKGKGKGKRYTRNNRQ